MAQLQPFAHFGGAAQRHASLGQRLRPARLAGGQRGLALGLAGDQRLLRLLHFGNALLAFGDLRGALRSFAQQIGLAVGLVLGALKVLHQRAVVGRRRASTHDKRGAHALPVLLTQRPRLLQSGGGDDFAHRAQAGAAALLLGQVLVQCLQFAVVKRGGAVPCVLRLLVVVYAGAGQMPPR